MKFFGIALFLGGAALLCSSVLPSQVFTDPGSNLTKTPQSRHKLSSFWQPFAPFFRPESSHGHIALLPKRPVRSELTRAETLAAIRAAASRHKVPAPFVQSIVAAESNFDCNAISPKGAIGLMQLMPETAEEYGVDPTIPEQNIDGGTRYLRVLMDRYAKSRRSLQRVIAAYNAGPGMVDRYRGIPPFRETRKYVVRVLNFLHRFELAERRTDVRG
jgi:Transglycosylase SLT domain